MSATAATLPTPEQLELFLHSLRQAEFRLDPDQMAGAQKILLLAHAETDDGLAARRLKTMLAPIAARSSTQQADFYRRFDALIAGIAPAPVGEPVRSAVPRVVTPSPLQVPHRPPGDRGSQ